MDLKVGDGLGSLPSLASYASFPFQPPPAFPPADHGGLGPVTAALKPNISIELENADMWREFHAHTTEMIVNKLGRRMFPTLRFNIRGLEEKALYRICVDLQPCDDHRYKYSSGRWTVNGRADPLPPLSGYRSRYYWHPDGPAPGALWMRGPISFQRLKVTNNMAEPNGHVLLNSMHKYQPVVYVFRVNSHYSGAIEAVAAPPEAQFITVTAYQNEALKNKKVKYNPFAKGFRDNGLHADKRRFEEDGDGDASPPLKGLKIEPPPTMPYATLETKPVKVDGGEASSTGGTPTGTPEAADASSSSAGTASSPVSSVHSFSVNGLLASPASPPKPHVSPPLNASLLGLPTSPIGTATLPQPGLPMGKPAGMGSSPFIPTSLSAFNPFPNPLAASPFLHPLAGSLGGLGSPLGGLGLPPGLGLPNLGGGSAEQNAFTLAYLARLSAQYQSLRQNLLHPQPPQ